MRVRAATAVALLTAALTPGAAGAAEPTVHLTVRYDGGERAPARTAKLRCGRKAVGTSFLRSTAMTACAVARRKAAFLASTPPKTRICTQLYGGPQTARVTGTVGSRHIDRRFSRTNGCGVADWNEVVDLLPKTRGAAPGAG